MSNYSYILKSCGFNEIGINHFVLSNVKNNDIYNLVLLAVDGYEYEMFQLKSSDPICNKIEVKLNVITERLIITYYGINGGFTEKNIKIDFFNNIFNKLLCNTRINKIRKLNL